MTNKAEFIQGNILIKQSYEQLYAEAENKAFNKNFKGNEDEVDEQQDEYILSYLDDCYQASNNVPHNSLGDPINLHQWLDWLQYGYFN
ncbi:hypothetical protein [Levilactobacillus phage ENFP1]|nr:hypothetical protein [Levilactobacillus phage ENFP1]